MASLKSDKVANLLESSAIPASIEIAKLLKENGVDKTFGVPGGKILPLLNAFKNESLPVYVAKNEACAAFMAAGYAQASGKLGVLFTHGPGTTNCVTGIVSAYCENIPLVLFCSQAPIDEYAKDAYQEMNGSVVHSVQQMDLFRSVSRFCASPGSGESLIRATKLAISNSLGNRQPSIIEIPANILKEEVKPDSNRHVYGDIFITRKNYSGNEFQRVFDMLSESKKPVLVLGSKLLHRGLADKIQYICDNINLPVVTTDDTKGIILENKKYCYGVLGRSAHDSARNIVVESDLKLAIGVRFTDSNSMKYNPKFLQNIIQVDDSPTEFGRSFTPTNAVLADLEDFIGSFEMAVRKNNAFKNALSRKHPEISENKPYSFPVTLTNAKNEMNAQKVFLTLREAIPDDALIVTDTGFSAAVFKYYFPIKKAESMYNIYNFGAMGGSFPFAAGVQLAKQGSTVFNITGDGGFLLHLSELSTLYQYNIKMVNIILNNRAYKSIYDAQQMFFGQDIGTTLPDHDFAKIADSFGIKGYKADCLGDIHSCITEAIELGNPCLIDIKMDPDEKYTDYLAKDFTKYFDGLFKG